MNEVLFFIFDNMTDYEITFAMHMLNTEGNKKIITIAYENEMITGRSGALYKPHRLVNDSKNIDADALIICGGWYGDFRQELNDLINTIDKKNGLLGGICGAGTYMLAKSGVLDKNSYTTPIVDWTEKHHEVFGPVDPFERNNYVNENVVRSGNVITSLGHTFIEFTAEILEWSNLLSNNTEKNDFLDYMRIRTR